MRNSAGGGVPLQAEGIAICKSSNEGMHLACFRKRKVTMAVEDLVREESHWMGLER